MAQELTAEVISIGTEILLGELTDTNSVFIARVMRDLGINLYFMTSVGDNEKRIESAIRTALTRAQIVITCGGLGPTIDDMTRQAVASATDRGLTFHQTLLDQIAARFEGYRVVMTENNKRQAYLPDNALVIENPVGTAPSFIVEVGEGAVISLPGVPREMKFLMNERVVPYLRKRYQLGIIKARILKAAGIGESSLDDMIGTDLLNQGNPSIGLAAHHGEIDVRITAKAETEGDADVLILDMENKIRARVGDYIYGGDSDTLETVLVKLMRAQNRRIAILQAGLGDVIAQTLRATEGGSDIIASSLIYDDPEAVRQAFALNGASLREMAEHIAHKIAVDSQADSAIVVMTYPDVDDAADNEESSVVFVHTPVQSKYRVYGFGGRSDVVRSWVTRWSLSYVWRIFKESPNAG